MHGGALGSGAPKGRAMETIATASTPPTRPPTDQSYAFSYVSYQASNAGVGEEKYNETSS